MIVIFQGIHWLVIDDCDSFYLAIRLFGSKCKDCLNLIYQSVAHKGRISKPSTWHAQALRGTQTAMFICIICNNQTAILFNKSKNIFDSIELFSLCKETTYDGENRKHILTKDNKQTKTVIIQLF